MRLIDMGWTERKNYLKHNFARAFRDAREMLAASNNVDLLLELYDVGLITSLEVFDSTWQTLHDQPAARHQLRPILEKHEDSGIQRIPSAAGTNWDCLKPAGQADYSLSPISPEVM